MADGVFAEANEVVAQMIYAGILILASILAIIMKYFGGRAFVNFYAFQAGCSSEDSADGDYYFPCAGDQAVYRISFGLVIFFLGMMPLGVLIKACHTGFWIIKIPIAIVCIVAPFFIPNEFFNVFFKVAYPFAAFYLIIQMLVIVGFAYDAHEYLVKKMDAHDEAADEDKPQCCNIWKVLYLGACIVAVLGIIAGIIFMFVRFSCAVPYIMISVSVVIAVVLILLALLDKLGQGLLVGVVIAAYATYLTWSALSSYPNPQKEMWKLVDGKNKTYWVDTETCNPFLCDPTSETATCGMWEMILGIVFSAISVGWTGWRLGLSSTRIFKDKDEDKDEDGDDSSLLKGKKKKKSYGSRSKTKADQDKLDKVLAGEAGANDDADLEEDDFDEHDGDNKSKKCCGCKEQAGRLFFYVVMDLACWYMAMLLTNWSNSQLDQTHSQQIGVGYTSMMVQFGAQWFMLAVYLWTVLAPTICGCRDFS